MTDNIQYSPDDAPVPLRALIVGAAGSAGQKFASSLIPLGVEVIAADQDEIGLARLRHEHGCTTIIMNALDDDDVDRLFELIESTFGSIDLLINVAGRGYVRTLAMMRISRAFGGRGHARPAYIVNLGQPAGGDDGLVTYAGSEIAFGRLSQSLSEMIDNPLVRILTLHRLESSDAFSDISERLCIELRQAISAQIEGTANRAIS